MADAQLPYPHADWRVPRERYQIAKAMIGVGSYGTVCEALDLETNRTVAIKRIGRVFEDLVDCKRILREIAILNRLNHAHVVRVVDICVPEDLLHFDELYLVLEMSDSDLKKLFRQPVFLSDQHIKTLLYNLMVGVNYVHSAGIYHRDLKPANCLVNRNCAVTICDFGLARTVDYSEPIIEQPVSPREVMQQPPINARQQQLTSHVVTRWYRAPEVILLQERYTEAIDVWSIGCIFAELLNMLQTHVPDPNLRSPLFPGRSAFPLSPDNRHPTDYRYHTQGNMEQLNMIFDVLGTPDRADLHAIQKEDARRYVEHFTARPPSDLSARFPSAGPDGIDLLTKMLVFNPHRRIPSTECLNHPYFAEVRDPAIETTADRVRLPFDDWANLDKNQLRYYFLEEVRRYHPNLQIPAALTRGPGGTSSST